MMQTQVYRDPKTGRILAGSTSPNKGKSMSEETKRKISKGREGRFGGPDCYWWGKHLSKETKKKISLSKQMCVGEKNSNWRGGTALESYKEGWFGLRKKIRERDGHICQRPGCGKGENGKAHDVHHVDYDKKNDDSLNLITLCLHCHRVTNGNREYWETSLRQVMINRFNQ